MVMGQIESVWIGGAWGRVCDAPEVWRSGASQPPPQPPKYKFTHYLKNPFGYRRCPDDVSASATEQTGKAEHGRSYQHEARWLRQNASVPSKRELLRPPDHVGPKDPQ